MPAPPAGGMRREETGRARKATLAAVAAAAVVLAAASAAGAATAGADASPSEALVYLLPAAHAQGGGGEGAPDAAPDAPPPPPVVISEAEINPPGDDRRAVIEWVELHNPSDSPVDVGGWSISSSDLHRRTLTIPEGTEVGAGAYRVFHHRTAWFADVMTSVRLHDGEGRPVDETPRLSDRSDDLRSWSRIAGGPGPGSEPEWEFGTASAGSRNIAASGPGAAGHGPPGAAPAGLPVSVSTDRGSYSLGDRIVVRGNVSEDARASIPSHANRGVSVSIEGPAGYERQLSVYPDSQLRFFASFRLSAVTGASDGRYDVTASYAGSSAASSFSVGRAGAGPGEGGEGGEDGDGGGGGPALSLSTDRGSYRPGETAILAGAVREVVPYEGLSYSVFGPDGERTDGGRLYPDQAGRFEARLFINPVGAAYGNHTIAASYGEAAAAAAFAVSEGDEPRGRAAALWTDKAAYAPGETVEIGGRLGGTWSFALDLELRQVEVGSLGRVAVNLAKHDATVRPAGDGTFSHEYRIANGTERLGEYVVRVSDTGVRAEASFRVEPAAADGPAAGGGADPAGAAPAAPSAPSRSPVTVSTDRAVYEQGSRIVFSGTVAAPRTASFVPGAVEIAIAGASGGLASRGQAADARGAAGSSGAEAAPVAYTLSAVPDGAGNYEVSDTLYASAYGPGAYAVQASYAGNRHRAYTVFEVVDSLDIDGDASLSVSKRLLAPGETAVVSGIVPGLAQGSGVDITVYKPGGDTDRYGALADRSRFSWEWEAPREAGVYQAVVRAGPATERIFLKVSDDPASDTLDVPPLSISADRASYRIGGEVALSGLAREAGELFGGDGPPVRERVKVAVKQAAAPFGTIYEYNLAPDNAGYFGTSFGLPVGVFDEGEYSAVATYDKKRAAAAFRVEGASGAGAGSGGGGDLSISVGTDRPEYRPGDTVAVSGALTRLVSVDAIEVTVSREEDLRVNCGTYSCGLPGSTETVRPDENGRFSRTYEIGGSGDAVGRYVVRATTPFATVTGEFSVAAAVPEDAPAPDGRAGSGGAGVGNATAPPGRYTEKFSRIPNATVPMAASESDVNGTRFVPRALQGLLLAPPRADPLSVDVRLLANASDGGAGPICVIGPAADGCLVSGTTRAPGAVYQTVQIGGTDYRVRYSGPAAAPEKFAVLPAEAGAAIDIAEWTAAIERPGGEPSWFYYKVTRVAAPDAGDADGGAPGAGRGGP